MEKKANSLYVHIPFCSEICGYCDFTKLLYIEKFALPYIEQLTREINDLNLSDLKTIYIGGGTPTVLDNYLLEKLLKLLSKLFQANYEFTVECNVETVTGEKLLLFKKYGVNRLSFGVQSFNDEILRNMERKHTGEKAISVIKLAKEIGFDSISLDLIYGIPNIQTMKIWQKDIEEALALDIDHISAYGLSIAPNTKFFIDNISEVDQDLSRDYYDYLLNTLRKHGYTRYEVSNFARNNKYSRHNYVYWNNDEYYGVGLGASGYIAGKRYQNTKNLNEYLRGNYSGKSEILTEKEVLEEYLLLKLRTIEGINKQNFLQKFKKDFNKFFPKSYNEFITKHLLVDSETNISCSDEGIMLMDYILIALYQEMEKNIS